MAVASSNVEQAAEHFAAFMRCLGHEPHGDPHLEGTPLRVSKMYAELLGGGEPFTFTTFVDDSVDQMVVVRDIPFTSFCAHHFLPFTGVAHVGYVPSGRIAGLSKLARAVAWSASRPQVQERLTEQVADLIEAQLQPRAIGVVLEARHECMELRGARAVGAITTTSALRGILKEKADARAEFFQIVRRGG